MNGEPSERGGNGQAPRGGFFSRFPDRPPGLRMGVLYDLNPASRRLWAGRWRTVLNAPGGPRGRGRRRGAGEPPGAARLRASPGPGPSGGWASGFAGIPQACGPRPRRPFNTPGPATEDCSGPRGVGWWAERSAPLKNHESARKQRGRKTRGRFCNAGSPPVGGLPRRGGAQGDLARLDLGNGSVAPRRR